MLESIDIGKIDEVVAAIIQTTEMRLVRSAPSKLYQFTSDVWTLKWYPKEQKVFMDQSPSLGTALRLWNANTFEYRAEEVRFTNVGVILLTGGGKARRLRASLSITRFGVTMESFG